MSSTSDFEFGVDVQAPWADKLLRGHKVIETRGYPLPQELVGRWVVMLESEEGGSAQDSWRITGAIKFGKAVQYSSREHWLQAITEPDYLTPNPTPKPNPPHCQS